MRTDLLLELEGLVMVACEEGATRAEVLSFVGSAIDGVLGPPDCWLCPQNCGWNENSVATCDTCGHPKKAIDKSRTTV